MVVIGFVLIIAAVAAAVILIVQNAGTLDVHALGQTWNVNAYWLVVAGLAAMAVAVLGVAMVRQAGVRTYRARQAYVPTVSEERLVPDSPRDGTTRLPRSADRPVKRSIFRHHASGA
jgi:hypothetical protein